MPISNSEQGRTIVARHREISQKELAIYQQVVEEFGLAIFLRILEADQFGYVSPLPASHDEEYEPQPFRPQEDNVVIQASFTVEAEKQGIPEKFAARVSELIATLPKKDDESTNE